MKRLDMPPKFNAEKMAEQRRNKRQRALAILQRRAVVARLYAQGVIISEIAKQIGRCHVTVIKDLKKIREEWLKEATLDLESRKAKELAKLDQVEARAYEGWNRSCEAKVMKSMSKKQGIIPNQKEDGTIGLTMEVKEINHDIQETTTAGDSKFLAIIQKCIEARLKIFGLLKEDSKAIAVLPVPKEFWDQLSGAAPLGDDADPIEDRIRNPTRLLPSPQESKPTFTS